MRTDTTDCASDGSGSTRSASGSTSCGSDRSGAARTDARSSTRSADAGGTDRRADRSTDGARRGTRTGRALAFASVALAAIASGCAGERPPDHYRVTFEVFSDLAPLPGASISVQRRVVTNTDARGQGRLELTGHDGMVVPVTVQCPNGTRGPEAPIDVTLRTMQVIDQASAARGIVQRVNCPPADRTVAIVVRTNGKAGIPITWQGLEVSRTDATGVANLTFRVRPAQQIQLALNTGGSFADLRPQSPTRQFLAPDADEVFVWSQDFELARPTRPVRHSGGGGGSTGVHRVTSGGGGSHRIIRIR